jgi:hypothetical protein
LADRAYTKHGYCKAGQLEALTFGMPMCWCPNVRYLHSIYGRRREGIGPPDADRAAVERQVATLNCLPPTSAFRNPNLQPI